MYQDKRPGHIRLVSSTSVPEPEVVRWVPPLLERGDTRRLAQVNQRGLNELAVDMAILSRRTGQILKTLNPSGSADERCLFQLTTLLEQALTDLRTLVDTL